jgi:hypothetical protein
LDNAVHKIASVVLWSLLSLLKNGNNQMQISESVPYRISTKLYRKIHGTYGKFHLCPSEKLRLIMDQYG